ncbi:MAG: cache domain-containing protein, partial [Cyanobacteria bacterium J06641_5]
MTAARASQFSTPTPGYRWHGLRHKAIVIAMLLGTLPMLTVGTVAYQIVKFESGKKVETLQQLVATGLHDKINLFMRDRYGDIQAMAGLDIFTDAKHRALATTADKEAALERLLVAYPVYDSIGLFDLDGNVIAQTAGKALENYRDRPFVREALAKDIPVLSQPEIASTSGLFSIYAIAPVKDKATNQTISFIRSRVPVSSFANLISSLGEDTANQYFLTGRDGNIFLGSAEKELLLVTPSTAADNDIASEFTTRALDRFFPKLKDLQASKLAGSILGTSPTDGKEQLIAYVPPKALEGLPELGWGVTLAIDADIAFAAQQQLLRTLVGGTALATLAVTVVAIFLAERATQPILTVTETIARLGQGQLGARVNVRGEDEVAQLGSNINQMAEYIQ